MRLRGGARAWARALARRPVSRWEAMRRAWAGWRLWGAKRRQAEPRNSQAVRIQRQKERARWLRQWLRWEAGVQVRQQARAAGAGEEPNIPPPPPEGTPERREWEERYAHGLHPPRPSQPRERPRVQENEEEQDQPPRWPMPWMDDWGTWQRDYGNKEFTLEQWYIEKSQTLGTQIEKILQQAREICERYGTGSWECTQAWEQARAQVEAMMRKAALQPQVPYMEPERAIQACLAEEAVAYMQQMEIIESAYLTALAGGQATPEQLTTLAGEMMAVAEEAARWGCGGVAAEARLQAHNIAETARYVQEAVYMQGWTSEEYLPPADYVVFSSSVGVVPALKGGMQFVGAQQVVQTLSKAEGIEPLTWLSAGGSLIWVPRCEEVIWCRGGSLGVAPGSVSMKVTKGWFVSQTPTCDEMAAFFTQAKVVEGGWWVGIGYASTSKYSAIEMGFYSPQISTNAVPVISDLATCTPLNLERTP